MKFADVVVVGGGISGLYTAWRLAKSTQMSIVGLEYSERFGGRFQTCVMPGGYPADMGAMRYLPLSHPIIHQLITDFSLPIEKLFINSSQQKNTAKDYYHNEHVSPDEIQKLYSFSKHDMSYCLSLDRFADVEVPEDGNFYKSANKSTGEWAKDVSLSQYATSTTNVKLLCHGYPQYSETVTVADMIGYNKQFQSSDDERPLAGYHCIIGGMERLIECLVNSLNNLNVPLCLNCPVDVIEETASGFVIKSTSSGVSYKCNKIILACNAGGMNIITWSPHHTRSHHLRNLFDNVVKAKAFKLFLTYECPWWEKYGLVAGSLNTDLPIGEVTAFGDRGKRGGFATLLAGFTYKYNEIFEGLNLPHYERYSNTIGDIPSDLQPSKRLVDYVQRQLAAVLACDISSIPVPVCASTKLWSYGPIDAANYQSRVGIDANELNWRSLKPFKDAHVYITGDTFFSSNKTGSFIGWSEGPVLTSERILVNYFSLDSYITGLSLANDWPSTARSKL